MSEDSKFGLILVVGLCVLVSTIGGCNAVVNHQDNQAMLDMVAKGADPLDAKCAIKTETNYCSIRAATKNK